ncbi:MAG: hypothetical protein CMM44_08520 [Rhodospirillaceae bacterium]|nr:hypothetical protein [Rhodospirillaceae bacterium]|tara:strand:+ start:2435 stop:2683 length:249 start_codon:yes stop_codon:yes gene_type:complete
MQNQLITEHVANLKGRRKYEEKKAAKLGFDSLYEYLEDKLGKQELAERKKRNDLGNLETKKQMLKQKRMDRKIKRGKSCSCC